MVNDLSCDYLGWILCLCIHFPCFWDQLFTFLQENIPPPVTVQVTRVELIPTLTPPWNNSKTQPISGQSSRPQWFIPKCAPDPNSLSPQTWEVCYLDGRELWFYQAHPVAGNKTNTEENKVNLMTPFEHLDPALPDPASLGSFNYVAQLVCFSFLSQFDTSFNFLSGKESWQILREFHPGGNLMGETKWKGI